MPTATTGLGTSFLCCVSKASLATLTREGSKGAKVAAHPNMTHGPWFPRLQTMEPWLRTECFPPLQTVANRRNTLAPGGLLQKQSPAPLLLSTCPRPAEGQIPRDTGKEGASQAPPASGHPSLRGPPSCGCAQGTKGRLRAGQAQGLGPANGRLLATDPEGPGRKALKHGGWGAQRP